MDLKAAYSRMLKEDFPDTMTITLGAEKLIYHKCQWEIAGEKKGLRYGENPDQPAALYRLVKGGLSLGGLTWRSPHDAIISAADEGRMLQAGKHPGKTNLTDVDNGVNILQYLTQKPACVILKHNNPSGAAWVAREDGGITEAVKRAWLADRIAAFGGALVANTPLTVEACAIASGNYFEVVAAPGFDEGALELLKKRKNLRILELPALASLENLPKAAFLDFKSLADGGLIVQKSFQNRILENSDFIPATAVAPDGVEVCALAPTKAQLDDLRFAWAVEAGVTSNSVIFAKDGTTVAIGTGEQDRVGCVELAIHKAYIKFADRMCFERTGLSFYEARAKAPADPALASQLAEIDAICAEDKAGLAGSVLVSDGFFPFRDGVDCAIAQGVSAIAQPGGSIRDAEVIMACNEAVPQVAMVFTGQRSFRH